MQSEGSQKEHLNRIITVPNLLSFFRFCLIPVIIWFHITPMVSDLLIGLCAIMMVVSVVLYIIKNTRTLRGETA